MLSTMLSADIYELPIEAQRFFSTAANKANLLVVMTIIKLVKLDIQNLESKAEKVKLIIVGKKGYVALKRQYGNYINSYFELPIIHDENLMLQKKQKIMTLAYNLEISYCTIYFNKFKNAMTQIMTRQQILPVEAYHDDSMVDNDVDESKSIDYEGENLISNLINLYVNSQINYALLQNRASEEGTRMTAMENATNNAHDIINKLVLKLNRSRQGLLPRS